MNDFLINRTFGEINRPFLLHFVTNEFPIWSMISASNRTLLLHYVMEELLKNVCF